MYMCFSKLNSDIEFIYFSSSQSSRVAAEGFILNDVPSSAGLFSAFVFKYILGGAFSVFWSEANPSLVIFLFLETFSHHDERNDDDKDNHY